MIFFLPERYISDLYHYTSPSGFDSILFNDPDNVTLWASRYDCLNDTSEGTIALTVFRDVCAKMKDNNELSTALYDLIASVEPAENYLFCYKDDNQYKTVEEKPYIFITSFSKQKDSLAMWNYYSKGSKYEGFNIGFYSFSTDDFLPYFRSNKKIKISIHPVVYDFSEQEKLVRAFLLELMECYEGKQDDIVVEIVADILATWSALFKSRYFQHEEEVRIIIKVGESEYEKAVKYRISNGYIIPYIEVKLDKEAVSSICSGPLQCTEKQKDQQCATMTKWLDSNGYHAFVDYSKIPVRY